MDFYSYSDKAIAKEIGKRIKSLRLSQNMTQKGLAKATMLSLNVIKALEAGKGKLSSIIVVLRELEALDNLDNFIAPLTISPLQLAKMQGKQRQRASGSRRQNKE